MTTITINIREDLTKSLNLKKEYATLAEAHRALGEARKFIPNLPREEAVESIEYQADKIIVYRKDGQFEIHAPMIDDETGEVFDLDFRPIPESELTPDILKKAEEAHRQIKENPESFRSV